MAIYTTYIEHGWKPADSLTKDLKDPLRHAAYYPLCDYSPELAAFRTAAEVGVRTRSSTSRPRMVSPAADRDREASAFRRTPTLSGTLLQETCRLALRDPDDLWDGSTSWTTTPGGGRFLSRRAGVLRPGPPRPHERDARARRLDRA